MTRKVTIQLRPEDLRDNPQLLELVVAAINSRRSQTDQVVIDISSAHELWDSSDPVAQQAALSAAEHALLLQRRKERNASLGEGTEQQPSIDSEQLEKEAKARIDRAVGGLALRGIAVTARVLEFIWTIGGPLVK